MPDSFLLTCSLPFKSVEPKLGIPARFDSDASKCFGTGGERIWGSCFTHKASFPFTRASHLPCRRKVVVRIYSCGSGRLLLSVKLVKTSVFDFLTANIKPRLSLIESKGLCSSRLEKFEVKDAQQISATAFDKRIIKDMLQLIWTSVQGNFSINPNSLVLN